MFLTTCALVSFSKARLGVNLRPTVSVTNRSPNTHSFLFHHNDTGTSTSGNQQVASRCAWFVLAGDSNTRDIESRVYDVFDTINPTMKVQTSTNGSAAGEYSNTYLCTDAKADERWHDVERVVLFKDSCVILTRHFIAVPVQQIQTLVQIPNFDSPCTPFNRSSYQDRFPSQPDLVWFSHGLWAVMGLQGATCEERFSFLLTGFRELQARSSFIIWQSNFKIRSHPSITNDIIDFDVKCQRAISLNNFIPMFDLDAYVRPRFPDSVSDYHVTSFVSEYVAKQFVTIALSLSQLRDSIVTNFAL